VADLFARHLSLAERLRQHRFRGDKLSEVPLSKYLLSFISPDV